MKCPNCEFDSPADMRYCGMCGTSLTRLCPVCQFANPFNYRYCGMCGALLENESTPEPLHAAQQPAQTFPNTPQAPAFEGKKTASSSLSSSLEGERRVAAILFADVKGSTELLEQIGTESWVEVMNNVFQVLEGQIYRYCGEVGQFRGDGLVAFFGAKIANEDDSEHAVLAALAIQEAIKPFAQELLKKAGVDLAIRVGVNTGDIIVANVGDAQYSEDTPMGEALTMASRMETAAEPGTVLVSENTYRLVRNLFEWQALGEISVKGISHPLPVFRPLTHKRQVEPGQESYSFGFTLGLIGRKTEYQTLKQRVENLFSGHGAITLVTGVKGMGKSFIVNQVRQHFARQNVLLAAAQSVDSSLQGQSVRWLHGRARSYGNLRPFSMWLDLIHEWIGAHPEEQTDEVQAVLRIQMETQWGPEEEKDYPNLATFLSMPMEEFVIQRVNYLDSEGLKRQFFQSVRDWIIHLAEKGPLVFSFADMQWADSSSLELLEYCLPLCDTNAILWILVYRSERDSPVWHLQQRIETDYPHRLLQLNIPPLLDTEAEEFIDHFVGAEILMPETRALIIKKAEGNPYFIKEIIFSLVADGALTVDNDTGTLKQVRSVASLDLPDSLQTLLLARIDRLSAGEKHMLQMAAVIGSVFWLNALQALAGPDMPLRKIQADLVELQRKGIIHERATVDELGMEYAFDSSLIREVAYESMLSPQRVNYHLKTAEYLEEIVFREGKRRYFNSLAHHYQLAGNVKKELFYTLQAAERAQNIYANAEALQYYTRALELLQYIEEHQTSNGHQRYAILTQQFEALNGRRAIYFLKGNISAGQEDASALLTLARKMEQDPTWLIDALLQQPGVYSAEDRDELEKGIPLAQEAYELAVRIGDKRREMNGLLAITQQRNLLNDPSWVKFGEQALTLAREIGDRHYEAMILLGLGHAYTGRDELSKGMEYLNAALPICQALDDKVSEMTLLRMLSAQYERSGDHYRRLVEFEEKRLAIAREIGDRFEEANALMFCGQIHALNLGDLEDGVALLQEALEILDGVSSKVFALLRLAQVQIILGQYDNARQTLENSAPVAERNVYDLGRVGLKLVTILLYNALGDALHLQQSLALCNEIIQMEESKLISRQYRMAAACEAAAAHYGLARLAVNDPERQQQIQDALVTSQIAIDIYNQFNYINIVECSLEEIYLRRSQALTAGGKSVEAEQYLELAHAEMMRKHDLIPVDCLFRRSFLENIPYHREIRAAQTASTLAKIKSSSNSSGSSL